MNQAFPVVYLARHGETAWSVTGQHTGLTDVPLTPKGERNAAELGSRLQGLDFAAVFTSPLQRAARTCDLAGFGSRAIIDRDLVEWDYGDYEGKRSVDINAVRPGWQLFRDGCPNGESAREVGVRADRVVQKARAVNGNVLIFSSGHILRALAARWLGLDPSNGAYFLLGTASVSVLGYDHNMAEPVIRQWNDTSHVRN
jgi:probable phosphoglycerate mutase